MYEEGLLMSKDFPVMLQDFTRGAFEDYLEQESNPVAIVTVGSVEQHGPHLPRGMDMFAALEVAKRVAEETASFVVHPCWAGYSPHHMAFKGTISFRAETLTNIILDTIDSLAAHGIDKVLLLNGHGGNGEIVNYASRLAKRRSNAVVIPSSAWFSGTSPKEALQYIDRHAGTKETELAQFLFGDLVEMERVTDFQPTSAFSEAVEALRDPDAGDLTIRTQLVMAYIGDTHTFTSSGIYGFADPNDADVNAAEKYFNETVAYFARLIRYWKQID